MSAPATSSVHRSEVRSPFLVLLSDALETPPRVGYHVHLLSLARAAAPRIPTRAFCWSDGAVGGRESEYLHPLPRSGAPSGRLARKRHYLARALRWIDEQAGPGTVVWVRSYSTALLLLPRLEQLARRVPGLVTVYDASSFHRLEADQEGSRFLGRVRGFVEEQLWRRFDRVRTLSEPMRRYLVGRGVPESKTLVIPVGSEARSTHWAPRQRPSRLLYVGSEASWQGLPELVEAMRLLAGKASDARLTVVGVGPESELARRAPGNVEFRGRVPHARIGEVYLEHDLFVLPRPRIPLTDLVTPMKLPEAMSFGMPILATDLEAVRWMAGDDGATWVKSNRPEDLAAAIEESLGSNELERRSAAALRRSSEFTWERIGEQIARSLFEGARA